MTTKPLRGPKTCRRRRRRRREVRRPRDGDDRATGRSVDLQQGDDRAAERSEDLQKATTETPGGP
jgi:hypothetical protein